VDHFDLIYLVFIYLSLIVFNVCIVFNTSALGDVSLGLVFLEGGVDLVENVLVEPGLLVFSETLQ